VFTLFSVAGDNGTPNRSNVSNCNALHSDELLYSALKQRTLISSYLVLPFAAVLPSAIKGALKYLTVRASPEYDANVDDNDIDQKILPVLARLLITLPDLLLTSST